MNYRDHPALSQTQLKELKKSPRHFWAKYLDPNREPEIETDAQRIGTAVHMAILEPCKFMESYLAIPKIDRRTRDGKMAYEAAQEKAIAENRILMDATELAMVRGMRDALWGKDTGAFLLREGIAESAIYWNDIATGIDCKSQLDYEIAPNSTWKNGAILELKTTINAHPTDFIKSIYNFGYYNQAAFYATGFKKKYGTTELPTVIFVAVEKTNPYESAFYIADEVMMNYGIKENAKLLALYAQCKNADYWSGYVDALQRVGLPDWVKVEEELI